MRNLVIILGLLFLAFLLLGMSSFPATLPQESGPSPGVWKGSLSVAGVTLDFMITFSMSEGTALAGTIDIPDQGAAGIHLGDIKTDGLKISFIIDDPGAQGSPTFEGELDEAGRTIEGTFSQSGYEGTFSMDKRSDS
jgi:hypothetical protein